MRPRNETARHQLPQLLAREAAQKAAPLAMKLGVSIPTLHRLLKELHGQVLVEGKGSRARYSLRRALRGSVDPVPVYEIGVDGSVSELTSLSLLAPMGTHMPLPEGPWSITRTLNEGRWQGLPWVLQDMRPQGFLGRQFARFHARLFTVSENPNAWTDDDTLHVLAHAGIDMPGNLIVGTHALMLWQERRVRPPVLLTEGEIGPHYEVLAEQGSRDGGAGSSAAGEFPKFAALRELPGMATPHVLVKYSGAEPSAAVRRWSDLLVCEHLALECVRSLPGIDSSRSRVLHSGGRTFLEVERFDRHGVFGRSPVVSLCTLNNEFVGSPSGNWSELIRRLGGDLRLEDGLLTAVDQLYFFGTLIGNTDMHTGNLSFVPDEALRLAPVYDMLPMMYAPLPGGEVAEVWPFEPRLPLPSQRSNWLSACVAAMHFWERASSDERISVDFRDICRRNGERLQTVHSILA